MAPAVVVVSTATVSIVGLPDNRMPKTRHVLWLRLDLAPSPLLRVASATSLIGNLIATVNAKTKTKSASLTALLESRMSVWILASMAPYIQMELIQSISDTRSRQLTLVIPAMAISPSLATSPKSPSHVTSLKPVTKISVTKKNTNGNHVNT
jgi:hypothetical protein